jgi:DNA-binding response OmpR family regulator
MATYVKEHKIEGVTINEHTQDVESHGQRLHLNRKEFLLAKVFLEHPNRVFSRFKLLDMVWDLHSEVESNVVEVTLSHLRRKIEKANANITIKSRRNAGYWLET